MKKLSLLLSFLFLFTGCNSYTELNDLGIINMIGIEKKENNYNLYATILEKEKEDEEPTNTLYEIKGETIQESFNHLSLRLSKKIYLSHLDLLVINDSIKTNELNDLINFFLNESESRNNFLVVTTNNIKDLLENAKFQEINNLVKINEETTSKSIYTTMFDVMNNYYSKKPIYFTNLDATKNISIKGLTKLENNKYEFINENKSLFINYLINNISSLKINLTCDSNKYLYLNILSSNTNTIKDTLIITNEIKVITNDCQLNKDSINKKINTYLQDNIKEFTSQDIVIKNTIRSVYEKH